MFRRWVGGIVGVLAVDGKTLRGSADGDAPPVQRVSAFSTELGRVLGQEKVAGKSNEITAIPELLEALHIKGLLVSIDAMGCQREIAARIVRAHWAIENRLHWMLNVCFGEDDCMIRKDRAPQNLSLLKKIVLNLIRADKTDTAKTSLRLKRKRAARDDDIRMKMLGNHPL